jgi:N utilization substance protein B
MTRVDPTGRRRARESALQMLYQSEVGRMAPQEAIAAFWRMAPSADEPVDESAASMDERIGTELGDGLRDFANDLVRETLARVEAIDQLLVAHAHNWRLERMAVIDRLVLRLAVCELLTHPETPPKVIINEALELARTFSGDEAVAFVNGVLDAVRKALPAP